MINFDDKFMAFDEGQMSEAQRVEFIQHLISTCDQRLFEFEVQIEVEALLSQGRCIPAA